MLFRYHRGLFEVYFLIDDLSLHDGIAEHVRQVDVLEAVVLHLLGVGFETLFDFDGFGIAGGSQEGEPLLRGVSGEVEDVWLLVVIEPDAAADVR